MFLNIKTTTTNNKKTSPQLFSSCLGIVPAAVEAQVGRGKCVLCSCSGLASHASLRVIPTPRPREVPALVGDEMGREGVESAVVGGGQALEPEISEFEFWSALLVLTWIGAYCFIFQRLALPICKTKIVPPSQGCQEDKRSLRNGWCVTLLGSRTPVAFRGVLKGRRKQM